MIRDLEGFYLAAAVFLIACCSPHCAMAVVLKKQSSSAGAGLAVDVALLIEQPKSALLPVLRRLDGWQEVRDLHAWFACACAAAS